MTSRATRHARLLRRFVGDVTEVISVLLAHGDREGAAEFLSVFLEPPAVALAYSWIKPGDTRSNYRMTTLRIIEQMGADPETRAAARACQEGIA